MLTILRSELIWILQGIATGPGLGLAGLMGGKQTVPKVKLTKASMNTDALKVVTRPTTHHISPHRPHL